jgi:uncharacterized membrane protein YkoI
MTGTTTCTTACAARIATAALLALAGVLALAPARAQEVTQDVAQDATHPVPVTAGFVCLDQKERRAEADSGRLIRLSAAMHAAKSRMPGTVVRARLCQGTDGGLVYVLTVLAHDGKVARITVDAANGMLVGER